MLWKFDGVCEFIEVDFDQCNSIEVDLLGVQRL